jgi:CO dehydrogenase/acetyl-CoA synthase epsilon subunit
VAALVNSPFLQTVVMGPQQPLILLGHRTRDFEWLQRVLKQRRSSSGPIRLTSNELAYTLEPLEVFAIQHLEIHENSVD